MWVTPRQSSNKRVVLTHVSALHRVNSAAWRGAASVWHDETAQLQPKPLLYPLESPQIQCSRADLEKKLIASLKIVLPTCASLRTSFSHRTPKTVSDMLMTEFADHPKVYIWNDEDPNPHMGHLAWADPFVITADSVNMLSKACSTGKVIGAERCTWKFADFH